MSIGYLITSQDDYNYCWQLGVGLNLLQRAQNDFRRCHEDKNTHIYYNPSLSNSDGAFQFDVYEASATLW